MSPPDAAPETPAIPSEILRSYDIRGVVPRQLSPAVVRQLGRAFGTRVVRAGGRRVSVGRDGRLSSPELEAALVEGLAACGLAVERIGLGPTPMLYFADAVNGTDGAVMLTGSHNPPDHNGMKIVLGGKPFYGDDIQDLHRIVSTGDYVRRGDKNCLRAISRYPVFDIRLSAQIQLATVHGNDFAVLATQPTHQRPTRHAAMTGHPDLFAPQ